MFKVTNVLNPLTGGSTTEEYAWEKGKTLAQYFGYGGECVVTCGDEVVDKGMSEIFPARSEHYTVMVVPEGMDRQTMRILGFAVMAGVSLIPGWGATVAFVGANIINLALPLKDSDERTYSQSYGWQHVSSPSAGRGLPMPVIYGKTRVRPTLKNRYIEIVGDKQYLYALYSLAAHKVDERVVSEYTGVVHAGEYGAEYTESAFPGMTFININDNAHSYPILKSDGEFDTDNWKVGHGTGGFYNDVIINGRAISEFDADVDWETRPGLPEQTEVSGFNATYNNYVMELGLYLEFPVLNNSADITYSTGLTINTNCKITYKGTTYPITNASISFRKYVYWTAGNTYFIASDTPIVDAFLIATYESGFEYTINDAEVPDQSSGAWSLLAQKISVAHNIELTFNFPQGLYDLTSTGSITRERCLLFAQYREYTATGTTSWRSFNFTTFKKPEGSGDQVRTDATSGMDYGYLSHKKPADFSLAIKATTDLNPLDAGKVYEVRVSAKSACIVNLVNMAGISYGEKDADDNWVGFTYPGEPLLAIRALATGQVSGDLDVQVDVERSKVWVYNERSSQWVEGDANNHAWAVYDILAQGNPSHPAYPTLGNDDAEAVYGCGIHRSKLDYESFRAWAEYVGGYDEGELGYAVNIVFDTFMTAWDAVLRICQEGRGMVYGVGDTLYAFTDKEGEAAQLFTMGNIQLGSFVQTWMKDAQKANMIEASYWDADNGYQRTIIAMRTEDWDSGDELGSPVAITLYGTTSYAQAASIVQYLLRSNELLTNTITFSVDIDSIGVQVGDVVEVQHDVLTIGEGGRIIGVDAVAGTITLDRTLTIQAGVDYELVVYHSNGTIERKTVTGGSNTAVIDWGPVAWDWVTEPSVYELYSFGVAGSHTNLYRVVSISRTNELMRAVTLMQYDEDVYESYAPTDATDESWRGQVGKAAVLPIQTEVEEALINPAYNVILTEVVSKRNTGEYESSVVVRWSTENGEPQGSWEVWYRDVDESDVDWKGTFVKGDEYSKGDKVELDGATYICIDDNTTSTPLGVGD